LFGLLVPSYLLTPLTHTLFRIISTPVRIHTPDSYPCSDYSCPLSASKRPLTIETSSGTCATHQTGAKVLVLGSDAGHEGYGEYSICASNTKAALLQDGWLTDVRFVAGLIVYAPARMARRYVVALVQNAARAERHATGPHDMLRVPQHHSFPPQPPSVRSYEIGFALTLHAEHTLRSLRPKDGRAHHCCAAPATCRMPAPGCPRG
jgi:hypothetical protein